MGSDVEESLPVDITSGGNEIESSEWQPVESPLVSVSVPDDLAPVEPVSDDHKDDTSPLGKRIRRASSKYEDMETKPATVGCV